jgi:hypothetical protein
MVTSDATRFLFHFDEDVINPNRSKRENRTAKKSACNNRKHLNKSGLDAARKPGNRDRDPTPKIFFSPSSQGRNFPAKSPF